MTVAPDIIASLVLQHFNQLPNKRKPLVRDNGVHEWVPLSGIVAQGKLNIPKFSLIVVESELIRVADKDNKLTCLSLATGMKCLPHSKLPKAQGNVLHDWHAEVLAIRAFNRFVLDEVKCLTDGTTGESPFLRKRDESEIIAARGDNVQQNAPSWHTPPFTWREDVKLHMYCSEAPCGDASMEFTMAAQDDASPWEVPPTLLATSDADLQTREAESTIYPAPLPGRAYFSRLGAVRLKPARGDAPPTMSKSCSDKLSLAQCTSLLSALTSMFVCPSNAYLHSIILPSSRYSRTGCSRAFSSEGRMKGVKQVQGSWQGGYKFKEFQINTCDREFQWSKRSVEARVAGERGKIAASAMAVAWTRHGLEETSLGGTIQGRKALDVKGASFTSRRKMWALSLHMAGVLGLGMVEAQKALASRMYVEVKEAGLLEARRRVKQDVKSHALRGWAKNGGDEDFSL